MRFPFGTALRRTVTILALAASAGAGASGCGEGITIASADSNANGLCLTVPVECGGDIKGAWRVESLCLAELAMCVTRSKITAYGENRLTFGADGMLTSQLTGTQQTSFVFDRECMGNASCDAATKPLYDCAPEGGSCNCTQTLTGGSPTTEPYTTSGNKLRRTVGTATHEAGYCVDGDRLYLIDPPLYYRLRKI